MTIKIGIVGYGNLGRGMECAISQNEDMELRCIFTRREISSIKPVTEGVEVLSVNDAPHYVNEIDVTVLCGGSAADLPMQTPEFARYFNVVDSFDIHAKIPEHFSNVDKAARDGGKTAIISVGWDPGLFSLNRMMSEAILTHGSSYTFWGKGVSQGHSVAIRSIDGVLDARQYTIPIEEALISVRSGKNPDLSTRQKHKRECFVVIKEDADHARIEHEIITMPDYFADFDTKVYFVSTEELAKEHSGMPHGGVVIRSGKTGRGHENNQAIEYGLKLDSNPEFTACALAAYARAACRLNAEGAAGCKTVMDVPPAYLSRETSQELRRKYL